MRWAKFLILACCACGIAAAAEIRSLDVERDKARVTIESAIVIEASRPAVYAALTDYDQFAQVSDRFVESRFIEPDFDGVPRIYTLVEGCVVFFCRSVERIARLEGTPHTMIVAKVETQLSDLLYGYETWELSDTETGTLVVYRYELEPDFWVPPVIGIWAMKRILNNDVLFAAAKIERIALSK
jgi:hypothetical protein